MSWLSNIPPGIKNIFRRDENDSAKLWTKCGNCGEMVFNRDLEAAHRVCPACDHHMTIGADARLALVFDNSAYQLIELPEPPQDPLKFRDEKRYVDRLKDNRRKTGRNDAMVVAAGLIGAQPAVVSVQDFSFMGGSMGMALGEALLRAAEEAVARRAPLIVFAGSGGARMQEGILSLMQMPRTTIAVQMVKDAGLPYIVVLTHPTTGGVTASYAMLGDIHLAEPGALIGFAGPRVIEQTIREKLPEGFQRAEFLMEKGMVDMVVRRSEIRKTLGQLISVLMNSKTPVVIDEPESEEAPAKASAEPNSVATPPAPSTPTPPKPSTAADLDKAAE